MKFVALFSLLVVVGFSNSKVDPSDFPVPPYSKKSLFYIHRSPNPNTVIYEVNLTEKNIIDPKEPVKVYWIRYGEKGQYRELNYIERTFAYGVKSEPVDSKLYHVYFVASKDRNFLVSVDERGQALATMVISGKRAKLTKIFVQVAEEGWWPKVAYVEFFGVDTETNKPAYEKMLIK
jgi:hypothetical protein